MSSGPLYAVCASEPWMITRMPACPASVTDWPLGDLVKLVPSCGEISKLIGDPLLNSNVKRSYPAWAPVWTRSMNATTGGFRPPPNGLESSTIVAPFVQLRGEGVTAGLALGLTTGATGSGGWWRLLATSRTPTSSTAITAAASPAIQIGPRRSGASSRAERTRSESAGLGDPLIASNALPSSRRKSSRVTSEHLLEGQIRSQPLRGAIDTRFG